MFVAIEGIDGAGTTTQTALIARALSAAGYSVHTTREPSDRPIGRLIRAELLARTLPEAAMALLFAADRLDHYENEIRPALATHDVVLSDRYLLSSLVYLGATLGDWPAQLNARAPQPDRTVLIEVPAELAAARRGHRGGPEERYDDQALQAELASRYAALAPAQTVRADGSHSPEILCAEIIAALALPPPRK